MNNAIASAFHRPLIPARSCATWFFLLLFLLYVVYSSTLIFSTPYCPLRAANISSQAKTATAAAGNSTTLNNQPPAARQTPSLLPPSARRYDTELKHIVFCIASSANIWERRKEYLKLWWRPNQTRGVIWLDHAVETRQEESLPEIRFSGDTSQFNYTNPQGKRSALRISRVVSETLRLEWGDVRWFVMGDDDTVFFVENLVRVLSKYDHRQMYYLGSSSESHIQNIFFSYSMAYGGGGFAISYPLAKELEKMQDRCIQRYPSLYGSDDRIQACMAELGVPLTKEAGFHQFDVYGSLLGLLGAHPVAPLVSMHHVDFVHPIFPRMNRIHALQRLFDSAKHDDASLLQQSICYDSNRQWSVSVSWGYVVQVVRGFMSPRELEMPTRTFLNWYPKADFTAYTFQTRPVTRHPCQKPFLFYFQSSKYNESRNQIIGVYARDGNDPQPLCPWKMESPENMDTIMVLKKPDSQRWQQSPRKDCCRVMPQNKRSRMYIWVGKCREAEISEL
ncbi:uncharacterized protein LOC127787162 [Diospyros lotus]|uniref:uncharacterized protein LOC127787162 n=1 Tax=Diospyros lotus TaxID=55363 RepID=UPI00225B60CD|nr:uncharacterized protein LOC127787162 [Diospyros lotus]